MKKGDHLLLPWGQSKVQKKADQKVRPSGPQKAYRMETQWGLYLALLRDELKEYLTGILRDLGSPLVQNWESRWAVC